MDCVSSAGPGCLAGAAKASKALAYDKDPVEVCQTPQHTNKHGFTECLPYFYCSMKTGAS